jgi:hypothetical protein
MVLYEKIDVSSEKIHLQAGIDFLFIQLIPSSIMNALNSLSGGARDIA